MSIKFAKACKSKVVKKYATTAEIWDNAGLHFLCLWLCINRNTFVHRFDFVAGGAIQKFQCTPFPVL